MSSTPTAIDPFTARLQAVEQLILRKDLRPAAEQLTALGREAPEHPLVYVLGMRLGEAAGNGPAALKAARRAVEVAPRWSFTAIGLAMLLARQNQFVEAVQQARAAVELAPEDFDVLTRAADVAHHAGDVAAALPWVEKASALAPENAILQRHRARDLSAVGRADEALPLFDALLRDSPDDEGILMERMSAALAAGQTNVAQADADRLLERDPHNEQYQFWQRRIHGETPATQPAAMVTDLFDSYAEKFDLHLVRGLQYDMPRRIAGVIRELYPTLQLNILDLGCGTGLLGVYLGRIQGAMIGVDLSEKMVEQAARHNVYDRFHLVNLLDALRETPDALYHVITACDVFIYVGDLSTAIPNAFRVLRPDGRLIFSCEEADPDGPPLVLRDSLRYAHRASAIESMCRGAGFDAVKIERVDIRQEKGEAIRGFYVVAHKPA